MNICPFDAVKMDGVPIICDAREGLTALTGALGDYRSAWTEEPAQARKEWDGIVDQLYAAEPPQGLSQDVYKRQGLRFPHEVCYRLD